MAVFKPFRAIRPDAEYAHEVSCPPYDIMNRKEAKEMASGNEKSFLRVIRSEIDLDDAVDSYDNKVYEQARANLNKMVRDGILGQDTAPGYYIYRQIMEGRAQTGLVGCASIDDYMNDVIKKHELTRAEKEQDRINHFRCCQAHTEPVFLTYRCQIDLKQIIDKWIMLYDPIYEFTSIDGIAHIVWHVADGDVVRCIEELFGSMDGLYIADGHHRSASSVKVGLLCREQNPRYDGKEAFNFFLTVAFPDSELFVMDYNRVVSDLNGYSTAEFLSQLRKKFDVLECLDGTRFKPTERHSFGMYVDKKWYILRLKNGICDEKDMIGSLDVSILQNNVLAPILGIENPRTDKRIDFIGGIRGLVELERRADSDMAVAFSMYPTSVAEIMKIADAGKVMPPKSTWFEPKLRSGLFVHSFVSQNKDNETDNE